MVERSREKLRLPGVGWLPQELGHLSPVIPRSELVFWAIMKESSGSRSLESRALETKRGSCREPELRKGGQWWAIFICGVDFAYLLP